MKICLLTCIVAFLFCHASLPPGGSAERILSALKTHYSKYPHEKIYVQTDKPVYSIGQTIWYKIYATAYGSPATLSKIIYVQLLDRDGTVLSQQKLPLIDGGAHGDILIPGNLPSDTYQLRCFTSWMLNFDEAFLFHKNIYIKNISGNDKNIPTVKTDRPKYSVQFFPEGGDLVTGTLAILAFKATDQHGLPADVWGNVADETGTLLGSFSTFHDGMGKFSLLPRGTHQYYATVHWPDSSVSTLALPAAQSSGISMALAEQDTESISIKILAHESTKGQYDHIILAVCQENGKSATYPLDLDPGMNIFRIPKKDFATGILRLTVFDENDIPRAERLVFVENEAPVQLKLTSNENTFAPKSKCAFRFEAAPMTGNSDSMHISVSVTDADKVTEDASGENIVSAFLLSSELNGYVHDPAYYFNHHSDSVQKALDLVMMTNGWRRFEWKQILNDEPVKMVYPVEKSLFLEGRLMNYQAVKGEDHSMKLIIKKADSVRFIGYVYPDSNGRFILDDYPVDGKSAVLLQQGNGRSRKKKYGVQFISNTIDTQRLETFFPFPDEMDIAHINMTMKSTWDAEKPDFISEKNGLLKAVLVRGYIPTKTEMLAKKYVSPFFESSYYHDVDLMNNNYPNSVRLFDFLKGRFPGLEVSGTEDDPFFSSRGSAMQEFVPVHSSANNDPAPTDPMPMTSYPYFYVNEVSTTFRGIIDIPLSDIALVRYVPPPASMAPFNGAPIGVLAIYLKKFEDIMAKNNPDEGGVKYLFNGYSISRQFYSPDYSAKNTELADNRETLYWNPDLTTDSSHTAHFTFYNSDHAKKFRIVAEGMDRRGRIYYFDQLVQQK